MMPHTVQRSHPRMNCTGCHFDVNGGNEDLTWARYGANELGFAGTSAYLAIMAQSSIVRDNTNDIVFVDESAGYRFDASIDPVGYTVDSQLDYKVMLREGERGNPLAGSTHPAMTMRMSFDPDYRPLFPTFSLSASPLNETLLDKLQQIIVFPQEVSLRGPR